jgi:hypothetical protein
MKNNVRSSYGYNGTVPCGRLCRGEVVLTPRRNQDYFPHPNLSGGEEVLSAGVIRPIFIGDGPGFDELIITNKTGHFQVSSDSLAEVEKKLEEAGYIVDIDPFKGQ